MLSRRRLALILAAPLLGFAACHAAGDAGPGTAPSLSTKTCSPAWLTPPAVDSSIAVPASGGGVLLHGAATGVQSYACRNAPDGGAAWALTGPRAELRDCQGALVARHFASDAGAPLPEWQSADGSFVIARKVAEQKPGGTEASVPWVLLAAVERRGAGPLGEVRYVQRVDTDGGTAPKEPCEAGSTRDVPYTADYYFYGP